MYNEENIDKQVTYENIEINMKCMSNQKSNKNLALLDKYYSVTTKRVMKV